MKIEIEVSQEENPKLFEFSKRNGIKVEALAQELVSYFELTGEAMERLGKLVLRPVPEPAPAPEQ